MHKSSSQAKGDTRGRSTIVDPIDMVGMSFRYLKFEESNNKLCAIFGLIPSSFRVWLDFSLETLSKAAKLPEAKRWEIRWPSALETEESANLLQHKSPQSALLKKMFAVVDGARMPCTDYTDPLVQNAYYEDFTKNMEVTNLLV